MLITTIANVVYVLVAIAMIVLILMQRGPGADAGSGFGGGASATVFGARGSANFLSKSTAVLACLFFIISMGMAMYANRSATVAPAADDLGVMGALPAASEVPAADPVLPTADSLIPAIDEAPVDVAPAVDGAAVDADGDPAPTEGVESEESADRG